MNYRHAAAFALLGWYLMVPLPPEKTPSPSWGDYFADLFRRTNSFSNWRIVESFDSANECEKVRVRDFTSDEARKAQTVLAPEPKSEGKAPEPKAEAKVKAVMDAFARAVCIATDDPRLAK
jgi:hypothetical protein